MDMVKIDEAYTLCLAARSIMMKEFLEAFEKSGHNESDELSLKIHAVSNALMDAADAFDVLINEESNHEPV